MDCFLPPGDLKKEEEEAKCGANAVVISAHSKMPFKIRSASWRISASKVVAFDDDVEYDPDNSESSSDQELMDRIQFTNGVISTGPLVNDPNTFPVAIPKPSLNSRVDQVKAGMENGALSITVPKEAAKKVDTSGPLRFLVNLIYLSN
ncbi:uncharacterized protein Pyn_24042 [Prunus yedoensis var. nudiflora]|uniref:SHSP domain-containing protein n=1 Tax=Prunus yedoensis var. nudiflora TaxID=2094558 RepID=A0A314XMJ1_PRUYE|nr:uncharacterized protein Pyn_24042 [Prunus yedoensis var. nudiflora]